VKLTVLVALSLATAILAIAVGLGSVSAVAVPPMFMADKTDVDFGEPVTFTNLCTLYPFGTPPYTKAEWDFDGDGDWEITLTGTHEEVTADVVWVYYEPGVHSVTLRMTDSTGHHHQQTIVDYITVMWSPFVYDTDRDWVISKAEALVAVADYFAGEIDKFWALQVIDVYFAGLDSEWEA